MNRKSFRIKRPVIERKKERKKGWKEEEEDVSGYWMTFGKREGIGN
jgi:hypothetical protein